MKRSLPLLLALVLLLCACGTAAEPAQTAAPIPTEALPAAHPQAEEGLDENELPIMPEQPAPATPVPAEKDPAALSDETVTLDGTDSYLRVTLPQGWTWEQAAGVQSATVYGLWPEDDMDFRVELRFWPERFGMCGTGVSFEEYPLPNGRKATLATEQIGEDLCWTLILPESPDSFTIQFVAPQALYESHRAELELLLGSIQQGVLAHPDVVQPETVTG